MVTKLVETSVIIRVKDEEKWIGTVLEKLFQQTYKDFEVIVVDSGSIDKTLEIVKQFPVRLFQIPPQGFSYPYALNYGIKRSNATKYLCFISGHSIPISETWFADGLKNFKQFKKIMGIYGGLKPLPDGTFWDKLGMNSWNLISGLFWRKRQYVIGHSGMGILGFTNAIILKNLWDKRHFSEAYGAGGEDGEWANYWCKRGYNIIRDDKFTVLHSHYLSLLGWYKQFMYWFSLSKPQHFKSLPFRKSQSHS